MIRYTVTVTLPDAPMADQFTAWLCGGHIGEVIAGGAASAEIGRIDGEPRTFEISYVFPSREAFDRYESDHAPRIREEGRDLFPPTSGVIFRRTVSEVIATFPEAL